MKIMSCGTSRPGTESKYNVWLFILILTFSLIIGLNAAILHAQEAPPAGGEAAPPAPDGGGAAAPAAPAGGGEAAPPAAPDGGGAAATPPAGGEATPPAGGEAPKAAPAAEEEPMKEYSPKDKSKEPKDPFKPLIAPPPPVTPPQAQQQQVVKKTEVQVPPLPLKVTFIVGSESKRTAVLSLNNKTYEMMAGEQEESGLFKILEITENKVKYFDSRIQKEREIVLQGL